WHKVYTSNWYENKIGVVDLGQMKVVKKIPTEDKPDGITYAPPFHKAYVSDERAKAEAVIDTQNDRVITTLHFDSETGVPQYDRVARKVYVNLQDRNVLAVIDPATDTVVGRYPVKGCQGNHGMAIDPERRRAFLSCEGNDVLAVVDLDSHQTIAHLPMANLERTLCSSTQDWGGSTSLVAVARFRSFGWTVPIGSASSRTCRSRKRCIAWSWT